MPSVAHRNIPDEVHRALRVRAAWQGRSVETELRDVLEQVVRPSNRMKLGSALAEIGRKLKLTDEEFAVLEGVRDRNKARVASFE